MADPTFIAGQHEALIKQLSDDMADVKSAVLRIELHMAEKRGERKAILWMAGSAGGVVSAVIAIVARYFK